MFRLARFALLILVGVTGCDIGVKPFAGTIIALTLDKVPANAPGTHLELWARDASNDVIRIDATYDLTDATLKTTRYFPYGFVVRPAITMDDPCMIDGKGNLLVTAAAYTDSTVAGVHQTAEEQAAQVRARIAQLTINSDCDGSDPASWPAGTNGVGAAGGYHCGDQPGMQGALPGLISYQLLDNMGNVMSTAPTAFTTCETSNNAPNCISFNASAADRLAKCQSYTSNVLAYVPNPVQITAPSNGQLLGVLDYVTIVPPGAFGAIRIDSPVSLKGIQELWITSEKQDTVDPNNRGPVLLHGFPDDGGRDIVHFTLKSPTGAPIGGTAALQVNLDQTPAQF